MADVTAAPDLSSGTVGNVVPTTGFGSMPGSGAPGASPYFPTTTPQQEQQVTGDVKKAVEEKMGADNALEGQFRRNEDRYHERIAQMEGRQAHTLDEMHPWDAQGELRKRDVSIWEQFGQPAFVLSMLASAFSAKPMNSALMAGGEAMTALKENRMQDYQRAFDAWKANSDLAIKRFGMEHEMHSEYVEDWSKDMESARIKASAAATRFGDKKMKAFLDAGMYGELLDYKEKEAKTMKDMAAAQEQVYQANFRMRFVQSKLEENDLDKPKTPEDLKKAQQIQIAALHEFDKMGDVKQRAILEADIKSIHDTGHSMDSEAIRKFEADQAAATHVANLQSELLTHFREEHPGATAEQEKAFLDKSSSRSPIGMIMQKVKEEGGSAADIAKAGEQMSFYMQKARTMGVRAGQIDPAVEEIKRLKPLAIAASKKVPRGDWKKWNEIEQSVLAGTSSTEMRDFYNYTQGIKNFAQTVMQRGGHTTEGAAHRSNELISTAEGPESYEHAINSLETEANIVKAVVDEMGGGTMHAEEAKPAAQMSDDELKEALKRKLQEQGGSKPVPAHSVPMSQ